MALLESLLEWCPLVLALDNAYLRLARLGVKVDYWLGDFDDGMPDERHQGLLQPHTQVVHTPDQEKTDFEKGVEFLIDKGVRHIHVLWALGRRLDHALANVAAITRYAGSVNLVYYNDYSKMYLLPKSFAKWYPKGQVISLLPMPRAAAVRTTGLLYPLLGEDLEWGVRIGTSNQASHDGTVTVHYESGKLVMIEAHDQAFTI